MQSAEQIKQADIAENPAVAARRQGRWLAVSAHYAR
jgi:hypothetical protein